MKRTPATLLALTALITSTQSLAWTNMADDPPPAYNFSYETGSNGRIVPNSVCKEYSGLDWKGCRRYANWKFSVNCWELGYEIKHKTGEVRRKIQREREFFCNAKRRVTTLR